MAASSQKSSLNHITAVQAFEQNLRLTFCDKETTIPEPSCLFLGKTGPSPDALGIENHDVVNCFPTLGRTGEWN